MLYLKHLSGQGKMKPSQGKVRENSGKSQGILKTYTSGNPVNMCVYI